MALEHWPGRCRPRIDAELRALIRRMNRENHMWGASPIHGELLMLGIDVAQSTVSPYMVRRHRPPSQGWKTFLRNHAAGIAAVICSWCELSSLSYSTARPGNPRTWAQATITIRVTTNPTAQWIAGQITDAFPWDEAPSLVIRDRDGAFGPTYTHRIRAMGIRDHPIAARSPWQWTRRSCVAFSVLFPVSTSWTVRSD
jgi:hypothetical protein